MKMDPKVTKALKQLSVTTGLSLSITQTDAPDELVSRIQQLERAYKENYSEEYYLCGLLKKETNDWSRNSKSPFLRMNTGGYVIVIQWDSKQEDSIFDLLRAVYPERKKHFFVAMESGRIAMVRFQDQTSKEELLAECEGLRDMIRSELLCECFFGIGKYFEDRKNCATSYEQGLYAIKVGKLFSQKEQVYSYEKLGLYRLVEDLSELARKEFVEELFGNRPIPELDEELKQIAVCFFEHDLNVSETARSLYMHRNTLLHKLDKIELESGQDIRAFKGSVNLMILLMMKQKEDGNRPC